MCSPWWERKIKYRRWVECYVTEFLSGLNNSIYVVEKWLQANPTPHPPPPKKIKVGGEMWALLIAENSLIEILKYIYKNREIRKLRYFICLYLFSFSFYEYTLSLLKHIAVTWIGIVLKILFLFKAISIFSYDAQNKTKK